MSGIKRLNPDRLPISGQKYVKLGELFNSVQNHGMLQGSEFENQVQATLSEIDTSLLNKKSAAEVAGNPYDLEEADLNEYCVKLEELENRAIESTSCQMNSADEIEAATYKSGASLGKGSSVGGEIIVEQLDLPPDPDKKQIQEVKKFVDIFFGICATITSELAFSETQNKKPVEVFSMLKNRLKTLRGSANQFDHLQLNVRGDHLMRAVEERLMNEIEARSNELNQVLGKLIKFQRIRQLNSNANGGNGDSYLQHKSSSDMFVFPSGDLFDIRPGPSLIEKDANSIISSYLSYAKNDNMIYILLEEHKEGSQGSTLVFWSLAMEDGNRIELKERKKWAESKTLSRISFHNKKLFGTCRESAKKSSIQHLDISDNDIVKYGDQGFVDVPGEFQAGENFIHFGTPDKLIAVECIGDNKVRLTILADGCNPSQQTLSVPKNMHTFLAFYRKDYLFLANEQGNDLVVIKIFQKEEVIKQPEKGKPFQVWSLEMSQMEDVHGIVAIDRGEKIYLVAIQLSNLSRLMIYEMRFPLSEDGTNIKPAIKLVQTFDLDFKVMALIRTTKNDKIVFITIEEQIGILELKDVEVERKKQL